MDQVKNAPAGEMIGYDIGIVDLLIVLARNKRKMVTLPIAAAIIGLAVSFALPNEYRALTRLLPPQQPQSGATALLAQLGGVAGAVAGGAGLKSPNDLYIAMLRSRTIADRMITRFDLKQVYNLESMEKTRQKLEENTFVSSSKDGLISVEVEDKDQKLVAKMANGYVEELLRLTRVLAVTEASQRRMFFERQLETAKNNLATAEVSLKGALDTRGVISVDSESRALLETVGKVRAQISAKEIQLGSMRAFVTTTNPDFQRVEQELQSLRAELAKLENGRSPPAAGETPVAKNPIGLENIKILRDVKYYEMLYELLAKQYEVARLDEAKDPSIIQVLDPAMDPERKSKPRRLIIMLFSFLAGLLAAIGWTVLGVLKERSLQTSEGAVQWDSLRSAWRLK